jgi:hypothetical protein
VISRGVDRVRTQGLQLQEVQARAHAMPTVRCIHATGAVLSTLLAVPNTQSCTPRIVGIWGGLFTEVLFCHSTDYASSSLRDSAVFMVCTKTD